MDALIPKGISIVICTYNGASRLPKTLTYLARQTGISDLKVEVIIVDNNSSDDTKVVANQIWTNQKAPFKLIILDENRPGKGYALETGFDAAQYSYLITVDDDNWLEENYLNRAFEIMHNKLDVGLAGGKGIAVFEGKQPEWFSIYAQSYAVGKPLPQTGYYTNDKSLVWGAGMIVRKQIWTDLRKVGFSFFTSKGKGKAVGEDSELSLIVKYLGYRHYFDDRLIFYHFMPANRINWQNHITMVEGFAKTSIFIRLYDYVGDKVNSQNPVSVYQFLLLLIRYTSHGLFTKKALHYSFSKNRLVDGDKNYADYRYFTAFWQWIYKNLTNLSAIMNEIKDNYIKLRKYKVNIK